MKRIRDLSPIEVRVLGALLEKERTTPDYYPMTVNSLLAACNQKSNRDPVMEVSETELVETLDRLRLDALAWRSEGARVERWSQMVSRRLELDAAGRAVLTLLMLRGPQTVGELRSRSGRLHAFDDLAAVAEALERLASEEHSLVVELPRQPGQKEARWAHLLAGEVAEAAATAEPAASRPARRRLEVRVEELEARVERLAAELDRLRSELG